MPYRHLPRAQRAAHEHPFALALIVMLLVVIPGFIRIEQVQHNTCERANAARRDQIALWTYVINRTARPHPSQQQRQVITDFKARLDDIFKPRECGW
jgi:hypothetical protein